MKDSNNFLKSAYSIPILLFLFTLFVFNIGFRYTGVGDTVPNELLPISIINEKDFDFNEFVENKNELPYYFFNVKDRVISFYPIIPGVLNTPVYLVAYFLGVNLYEKKILLSMLSSSMISSLSVVFMYLCLTKICKKKKIAISFALTYAFATCVWSVASRGMWQHGPSLLFITASLFLIFSKSSGLIPYSGFFLGLAFFNRPTNIVIVLPLTIYVFLNYRKGFKKYIILVAIPMFLLCLYSYIYWGSIMSLGQGHSLWGDSSMGDFSGKFLSGLAGLLFSLSSGIFVYSPIFIFSFGYLFYALFSKNIEPIYKYLSIAVICYLLLYSKWSVWWGGWSFGYRLLIELVPILIIFLAIVWERVIVKHWYLEVIFLFLLLNSIYIHFLGAFYWPTEYDFNRITNNINVYPELRWDFKNTAITRCTKTFYRENISPTVFLIYLILNNI